MMKEFKDGDLALPLYTPEEVNTLAGFMSVMQAMADTKRECCLPAVVEAYSKETRTATVKPLVKYVYQTIDGEKCGERDSYVGIPVFLFSGCGYVVDMPVQQGTTGLLIAVDREWSQAKAKNASPKEEDNEGSATPMDRSVPTFANGIFIPFSFVTNPRFDGEGMAIGRIRGEDTDYVYNFAKDRVNFIGNITRESTAITDVRWNPIKEVVEKKYVDVAFNGDMLVGWGDESDWISYDIVKMTAMTEWVFDQEQYGVPQAIINGEVVCAGHSTTHIIDYDVAGEDPKQYQDPETGIYTFKMTMSIRPEVGRLGGPCEFRCWNNKYGNYDDAHEGDKASVFGDNGTMASFRITFDPNTKKWTFGLW